MNSKKIINIFLPTFTLMVILSSCGQDDGDIFEDKKKDPDKPTFKTEIVEVTNPKTGRIWMDRNLGAKRAALSPTDSEAYGDLYQWGRSADGHEDRNSETTNVAIDNPNHNKFITQDTRPTGDWRITTKNDLWRSVNAVNNPCPDGFRIPTEAELNAERASWDLESSIGAFNSNLKWTMAGARGYGNGQLIGEGSRAIIGLLMFPVMICQDFFI
jgi:hypothetical protein